MGCRPLVVSTGSGSEIRQPFGVTVFFGVLGVTLFGLIFTPILRNLAEDRRSVADRHLVSDN